MASFQAIYYRDKKGVEPVAEFVASLELRHQEAIDNQIELLNFLSAENPHLGFPHSSQVEGELRELRCHYGKHHYRILYRRSKNLIVLLHAFAKTSAKIPRREIETAMRRWVDFKERMDALQRRKPRAVGKDAP